jgi:hypothetical protein
MLLQSKYIIENIIFKNIVVKLRKKKDQILGC